MKEELFALQGEQPTARYGGSTRVEREEQRSRGRRESSHASNWAFESATMLSSNFCAWSPKAALRMSIRSMVAGVLMGGEGGGKEMKGFEFSR